MNKWVTTKIASELLGLTTARIKELCGDRTLKAKKPGRDWLIDTDCDEFRWRQAKFKATRKRQRKRGKSA